MMVVSFFLFSLGLEIHKFSGEHHRGHAELNGETPLGIMLSHCNVVKLVVQEGAWLSSGGGGAPNPPSLIPLRAVQVVLRRTVETAIGLSPAGAERLPLESHQPPAPSLPPLFKRLLFLSLSFVPSFPLPRLRCALETPSLCEIIFCACPCGDHTAAPDSLIGCGRMQPRSFAVKRAVRSSAPRWQL